jgi:hypothetical protein
MITIADTAPSPRRQAFHARLMHLLDARYPAGDNLEFSPRAAIRELGLTDREVLALIAEAAAETQTDAKPHIREEKL